MATYNNNSSCLNSSNLKEGDVQADNKSVNYNDESECMMLLKNNMKHS